MVNTDFHKYIYAEGIFMRFDLNVFFVSNM